MLLSGLHRVGRCVRKALKRLREGPGPEPQPPLTGITKVLFERYEELRREDPAAARRIRRAIHVMADYQQQKAAGVRPKP